MFNPLGFISKFIKSSNQRELDRIGKIVREINAESLIFDYNSISPKQISCSLIQIIHNCIC